MMIDNLANLKIDQNHLNKGKIQGITRDETSKKTNRNKRRR